MFAVIHYNPHSMTDFVMETRKSGTVRKSYNNCKKKHEPVISVVLVISNSSRALPLSPLAHFRNRSSLCDGPIEVTVDPLLFLKPDFFVLFKVCIFINQTLVLDNIFRKAWICARNDRSFGQFWPEKYTVMSNISNLLAKSFKNSYKMLRWKGHLLTLFIIYIKI